MVNFKEVLSYNDQPVICPECGNRTEIILDLSHTTDETQIHVCLDKNCNNEFVTQKDRQ